MSEIAYLAIALAMNPDLANEIKKEPRNSHGEYWIKPISEELGRISSIISAIPSGGGMQPSVQPTGKLAARHLLERPPDTNSTSPKYPRIRLLPVSLL